jgi:hypothetical protein
LNKIKPLYVFLFTAFFFFLTSCSTETSIHGLWQDTNDEGTIEFKSDGSVIIIDNMSATVTGTFNIQNNKQITFELTATDIMQDSIKPIEKTTVIAKILEFDKNKLKLSFGNDPDIESYERVR